MLHLDWSPYGQELGTAPSLDGVEPSLEDGSPDLEDSSEEDGG